MQKRCTKPLSWQGSMTEKLLLVKPHARGPDTAEGHWGKAKTDTCV